ncbi:hypothetical protein SAMN03097699_1868 [Flavobacteriaceae bacterium MAR_2010_188]|nr:hypothetical protein SAMN03097699_1868 [Flavobacteriaceae bacterium MAR_2010_188]
MIIACKMPAQTVYVTNTWEKYHKTSYQSKHEITLEKAPQLGYNARSVCKPIYLDKNSSSKVNLNALSPKSLAAKQKATTTQNTVKTKSGSRRRRLTKSANGRYYQR